MERKPTSRLPSSCPPAKPRPCLFRLPIALATTPSLHPDLQRYPVQCAPNELCDEKSGGRSLCRGVDACGGDWHLPIACCRRTDESGPPRTPQVETSPGSRRPNPSMPWPPSNSRSRVFSKHRCFPRHHVNRVCLLLSRQNRKISGQTCRGVLAAGSPCWPPVLTGVDAAGR